MNSFLITLGVILFLVILFYLFRVQTLASVLKGSYKKKVGFSNKVNAILFPIFFIVMFGSVFLINGNMSKRYLPESASEHGVITDNLFWITMAIICFVVVVTHLLLFYFPFKYQYDENRKAAFYPEDHKLEYIWTIIPAIVLSVLVFFGWRTWSDITAKAPENAVSLEIMGKQFAWQVRYPGADGVIGKYNFRKIDNKSNEFGMDLSDKANFDDFVPREIHIPKGRPVVFKIRAKDVLHSVFLPHFRQKMDAVPGMPTTFWFVPKYTTSEMKEITGNPEFKYELACTEICGRGHFAMRYIVVVDEPEDFEKWQKEQQSWLSLNMDYVDQIPTDLRKFIPNYSSDKINVKVETVIDTVGSKSDSLGVKLSLNN